MEYLAFLALAGAIISEERVLGQRETDIVWLVLHELKARSKSKSK